MVLIMRNESDTVAARLAVLDHVHGNLSQCYFLLFVGVTQERADGVSLSLTVLRRPHDTVLAR